MRSWRPLLVVLLFLGLVAGALYLIGFNPYRQIVEQNDRVTAAREQLEQLEMENDRLRSDIEALDTPEELERLAREKLGYVRWGEEAFVVVSPPSENNSETAPAEVEAEPEEVEEPSVFDRIWDFVTGADI